jgi:putative acyl-CoA dehydrogenase
MGMGMTEKQGGSDVRANTTRADHDGDDAWGRRYRITGHKWFFSAPMCDAFLVLAQAAGGPVLLLPAAPAARRHGQRDRHPAPEAQARQPCQRQLGGRVRRAAAWLVGDEGAAWRRSWPWARSPGSIARSVPPA